MERCLGLLFLRYVSEAFERRHMLIVGEEGDPEDRDEYLPENIYFVPERARRSTISNNAKDARIGVMVDDAMLLRSFDAALSQSKRRSSVG